MECRYKAKGEQMGRFQYFVLEGIAVYMCEI